MPQLLSHSSRSPFVSEPEAPTRGPKLRRFAPSLSLGVGLTIFPPGHHRPVMRGVPAPLGVAGRFAVDAPTRRAGAAREMLRRHLAPALRVLLGL